MKFRYNLVILLLSFSSFAVGQQRPGFDSNNSLGGTKGASPEEYIEPVEDTVRVRYFTLADISKRYSLKDTLFEDFEKYASVRRFRTAALTLGNLGSSHLRILYEPRDNILTIPGFTQFRNYQFGINDLKYYTVGDAFNDLFFSPVAGQDNFKVQAKFSNNFANDVNVSLELKRLSQVGFYSNQTTKSTAFGFGLWKNNKEKNLQTFFSFIANNNNEDHNGGIIAPSPFRVRIQESTYLNETDSRHQNFKYALDNFFAIKENKYKVHHQLVLENGYYHYADNNVSSTNDTLIYRADYLTNEKGIRFYMDVFKVKNTFDVSFTSKAVGLKLGILHQFASYSRDLDKLRVNDVIALADLNLAVGKVATLDAHGEIGLGTNAGNINLSGLINLKPLKDLSVQGKIKLLRYDPTLIQESISVSNTIVYNNDFAKINELVLGAQLFYDKLNLSLEFNSGVIDKPISYNSSALQVQKDGTTEYIQALATHKFQWRFIGFENSACYQQFTDNVFRLPDLYSIHNVYVQFPMFRKKLLTRLGGLYYFTRIKEALEYFPITGGFIPSDQPVPPGHTMNEYPYMEVYANFKIKSFRLFIKAENFQDLVNRFPNGIPHYQILNYPQFDYKLRMGVRWIIRG